MHNPHPACLFQRADVDGIFFIIDRRVDPVVVLAADVGINLSGVLLGKGYHRQVRPRAMVLALPPHLDDYNPFLPGRGEAKTRISAVRDLYSLAHRGNRPRFLPAKDIPGRGS